MLKKIGVVTGSRSEYGLLYWLLKEIKIRENLQLQVIATAMHLSHEFGLSYKKILEDGFKIDEKVEMLLSSDTAVGITKSIGLGVIGFADAYQRLQPDMVVLLGDRFETLAAATAAFIAKIPIAHIHGGELSLGAYDDGIRHSVTKMAHLHFTAINEYRERVIQLGEDPASVFQVGPMVLDSLHYLPLLTKEELEEKLGLKFQAQNFVITFHPATLGSRKSADDFGELLAALEGYDDTGFIFTKANADSDGRILNDMIDDFCRKIPHRAKGFIELGHQIYLSLLKVVNAAIGNSSSGVIEVPYFKIPTVNIGTRQQGRYRPQSVIDCPTQSSAICAAINKALSCEFTSQIQKMTLPFGDGNVAKQIVTIIENRDFTNLVQKSFYDIKREI